MFIIMFKTYVVFLLEHDQEFVADVQKHVSILVSELIQKLVL
jgi:hypothetical protein